MRRRGWKMLTWAGGGLFAVNVTVLVGLYMAPEPPPSPEAPPPMEVPGAPAEPVANKADLVVGLAALDRNLAARLEAAAVAAGRSGEELMPSEALRAAALASDDPEGPEAEALLAAYGEAFESLGVSPPK